MTTSAATEFLRMPEKPVALAATGDDAPPAVHAFEPRQVRAINAALAARRPLLVRGEPGIGKSQLARAAAKVLGRAFLVHTVDARTEARDLLWHFDAVARLAEAQLIGALHAAPSRSEPGADQRPDDARDTRDTREAIRKLLAVERYLHPRALWWAFDWPGAEGIATKLGGPIPPQPDGGKAKNGCVLLIDEIDKAEADVPNGLLEALGAGCFHVQGRSEPVAAKGIAPLVVVTTNEERALPDAFVRRCLVLHLRLPSDPQRLKQTLVARGQAHFKRRASMAILSRAADLLIADRNIARDNHWLPLPGQAEYLDLVRAVVEGNASAEGREALLSLVAEFVLKKHPDAFRQVPDEALQASVSAIDADMAETPAARDGVQGRS